VGGVPVCTAPLDQTAPRIVDVGGGSVVILWIDRRAATSYQLRAQRLTAEGKVATGWPVDGLAVGAPTSSWISAAIVSDQADGAIVAWADRPASAVYALRVLANGQPAPGWPAGGLPLCTAPGGQSEVAIVPDGQNGALVSWTDDRRTAFGDVYALRVTGAGVLGSDIIPEPPRLQALSVSPNPIQDHGTISFRLPSPAIIGARVYDLRGRILATLATNRQVQAGRSSLTWLGRDDSGNEVAPGVYFVQVETAVGVATARVIKL